MNLTYLQRLKMLYEKIPDEFSRAIFYFICKKYQEHLKNTSVSKNATKKEILLDLIDKNLLTMTIDKETKEEKLPDDRTVRSAVRKLMKSGFPILASSKSAGYYICDNINEISQPLNENHKRALKLLAMEKSYQKMSGLVSGQISIDEINFDNNDDNNDDNE
jgi:hypothetical protein